MPAASRWSIAVLAAAVVLFAFAGAAIAAPVPPNADPLTGSTFEGGDAGIPQADQAVGADQAQKPNGAGRTDWTNQPGVRTIDDPEALDSMFEGGDKELSPGSWNFITKADGVTPGKDNIQVVWTATEPSSSGTFLYAALKRETANGDTFLTFELNQVNLMWDPDTLNPNNSLIPCRTTGDVLIAIDVTPAGTPFDIVPYIWTTSTSSTVVDGDGVSHECARTGTVAQGNPSPITDAEGSANWGVKNGWDGTINNYLSPGTYGSTFAEGTFAEIALNITRILDEFAGGDPCTNFGSLQVHSRSAVGGGGGDIATSQLQDLVGPVPLAVRSCGVTGFKWNDLNGDGVWDKATEPGLAGWTIYVDKNNNGVLDAGEPFDITAADGSYDIGGVKPAGDYTVREQAPSGADPSWTCTYPAHDNALPGTNDKLKCGHVVTFTNGTADKDSNGDPVNFGNFLPTGKLEVKKTLVPAADTGKFNLLIDGNAEATNVGNNGTTGEKTVGTGNHTVNESAGTGTTLLDYTSSVECRGNNGAGAVVASNANGANVTVNVTQNSDIVCVITNTRKATIEIEKQTVGGDSTFDFTPTASLGATFQLSDNGVKTFTRVTPNNGGTAYTVTEATKAGWRLTNVTCGDTDSSGNIADRQASIHVSPGETTRCTFTNTKLTASIDIVKTGTTQAHHGDPLTFQFAVTNTGTSPLHDVVVTDDHCSPVTGPTDKQNGNQDDILDPAETWIYTCTYNAPANHTQGEADPIHNIATVNAKDETDQPVTDTASHDTDLLHPAIHIVKNANPTTVHVGDPVTYTFTVTNTGDTPLKDVVLTDAKCDSGTLSGPTGDANNDQRLDLNETWVYTCTRVAQIGDAPTLHNTATVTGKDDLDGPATDDDSADVQVINPGIHVVKKANTAVAHVGDTVTYTFTVTNTGNGPLSNVTLSDPKCDTGTISAPSGDANNDGKLDVSETWTYTCTHKVAAGDADPFVNVATACGKDDLNQQVCDDDTVTVDVIHPGIHIVKKANPTTLHVGDTVTYVFTVTNTGDTPLSDVTLGDPKCDSGATVSSPTGDANNDGKLDVSETWSFTCLHKVTATDTDPFVNVATACGTDALDEKVCDDDTATVDIIHPAVDIEKTGPATANAGDRIKYTLVVTNPGDTPLVGQTLAVTDALCDAPPALVVKARGTDVDPSPDTLDPGDTWVYECFVQTQGTDTAAVHNVANVVGFDTLGAQVTDTDDADTTLNQQQVLPENIVSGASKLSGPSACVSKSFKVKVTGRRIAKVVFKIDGKTVKTFTSAAGTGKKFTLNINPKRYGSGVHRLKATVTYAAASQTKPRTLQLAFEKCKKQAIKPQFTG